MAQSEYPLQGLKVLDFSRVLAGPFAGRMLCDLGADVVKIEPPEGDITRLWGRNIAGIPGYYHQQNAGKRDLCIDLRAEGAQALVFELVAQADIVIENYRPDVMGRLGIDYASLAKVNPRLIMLSISGFGHGGPESLRPAYAPVVHAEVGLINRVGQRFDVAPHDMPLSLADTNASLHGLVGLLSAVIMRERSGVGQHIDIAMIDATIATDDHMQYDLEVAHGTGSLPSEVWDTPIGPVLLSTDARYFWKLLTKHFAVPDPSTSEMTLEAKIAARRGAMEAFMQTLATTEQFEAAMVKMNMAWGRVRASRDMREQPTVKARGTIVDIDDRAGGTRPITQSPYRFSAAASGVRGPAPHRGEHNQQVLAEWLHKSVDQVTALQAAGVLQVDQEHV
ncbi:MAG: CaiB/BaiF CoA transferase family protein [Pseudomonadales bacterium]